MVLHYAKISLGFVHRNMIRGAGLQDPPPEFIFSHNFLVAFRWEQFLRRCRLGHLLEESFLDQIYQSKYVWIFIIMI